MGLSTKGAANLPRAEKATMTETQKKWLFRTAALIVSVVLAVIVWQRYSALNGDDGMVSGNGRIEAVEIDVASRTPGRLHEVLVNEGDFVTAGQAIASMDTETLKAQLRQAEAQLQQARSAIATAQSQLAQRESDRAAAQAMVAQREAELNAARSNLARALALAERGFISPQAVDDAQARLQSAEASRAAAHAQVSASTAAIASAQSQVEGAKSSTEAAQANLERIQADMSDSILKAPRDGRIQYLVAQPGEIVGAGGRILNMVDLGDVYMTFFLPTAAAGRIAVGSEVRIVLDAAPQHVIPARISFVADVAQFTPKTVETASEREKLMFRLRAKIAPELLKKHIMKVKTGLPGVAYVKLDPAADWPERLRTNLVQ